MKSWLQNLSSGVSITTVAKGAAKTYTARRKHLKSILGEMKWKSGKSEFWDVGLMGAGIAQVAATAGYQTVVKEVSEEFINKGFGGIEKSLAKFAEKGTITGEQQTEIRGRLSGTTSFDELADCDIIIEAIIENLEEKRSTYRQLDELCKPETIFASNTSSLSITEMMTATSPERQQRFIGMHFFNPVPLMKLVEVVTHDFDG